MDATKTGILLYQEIEAIRTNGRWGWEKSIAGPLNGAEVHTICRVAGCWCDVPSADAGEEVRFYTNHNHPEHGGRPS